ncbi:Flagellar hook-length control protein FliK [Paenibacillus pasadenensis]|uniref:Flagellar hook-length control protein FliK n=1 Tax=Paenibacillus pasadenensis TaxID=217090 RepID=A0A2N5N548_9BACL|nr:Flagellar hook-length control protein FliK [Paenibacillus pasadenensis]
MTGRYSIEATISYSTTASLSVSLGSSVTPAFVIQRTSPVSTVLVTGLFPVLDFNIALLLTLRAILGSATITMVGEYQLNAGDVIGIYYVANGLSVNLNLGGAAANVSTWAIHQMA